MEKNEIYKLIQEYLKDPPVIIWGSGATIACGLPSMNDLNDTLKVKFSFFDKNNTNLENELGKTEYEPHISEIRKCIWECIAEKDVSFLNSILEKSDTYIGVKKLIEKRVQEAVALKISCHSLLSMLLFTVTKNPQ